MRCLLSLLLTMMSTEGYCQSSASSLYSFVEFRSKNSRKEVVEKEIRSLRNIDSVISVVDRYINPGTKDYAILKCETCIKGKRVIQFPLLVPPRNEKAYAGYYSRGEEAITSFKQLVEVFRDTITVIDSLRLSVTALQSNNEAYLGSLRVQYKYLQDKYVRPLSYYADKGLVVFDRQTVFGNMTGDVIRNTPVVVYIQTGDGPIGMGKPCWVVFLTEQEKDYWKKLYESCRKLYPESDTNATDEVVAAMQQIYPGISDVHIRDWLHKLTL